MSAHLEPLPIVLIGALLILHARLHSDRIGRYYERENDEARVTSAEPSQAAPETTEASVAERSSARTEE